MTGWFKVTPESERLLSEERLILAATELIYEAMEETGTSKAGLAEKLGLSKSEVGQRLSGRRNLTIRSLASTLHALDHEACISIRPCTEAHATPRDDLMTFRKRIEADPHRYVKRPISASIVCQGSA